MLRESDGKRRISNRRIFWIRVYPEIRHKGPHSNLGEGEVCGACAQMALAIKIRERAGNPEMRDKQTRS